jgi:hypothetical protein
VSSSSSPPSRPPAKKYFQVGQRVVLWAAEHLNEQEREELDDLIERLERGPRPGDGHVEGILPLRLPPSGRTVEVFSAPFDDALLGYEIEETVPVRILRPIWIHRHTPSEHRV